MVLEKRKGLSLTFGHGLNKMSRASTRPTKDNEKTRQMENQLLAFSWWGRIIIIPPGC
jgi:hypothetical protein